MLSTYSNILLKFIIIIVLITSGSLMAVVNQNGNNDSYWWYAEGVIIINFQPEVDKSEFKLGNKNISSGLTELDQLFDSYSISSFEQLFDGAQKPVSKEKVDLAGYYRISFDPTRSLDEVVNEFSKLSIVEHVEKVGVHPITATPNDSYYGSLWALDQANDHDIDAPAAWDIITGDSTVLVGAMDTGVQWDHPDLAGSSPYVNGNIWINLAEYNGTPFVDDDGNGYIDDFRGWDWVTGVTAWAGEDGNFPDNDPMDFNGHGTHTAGTMAAITNNNTGISGVAGGWLPSVKGCRIVPLRIGWSQAHPDFGYETGYVRMDFAAQAFYYATQIGVTAVNCSWGSSNSGGIAAAINNAISSGMTIVNSAGNSNNQSAGYLSQRSDVISVASTTSSDTKSSFSNYGTWVDVSAPGSSIRSTYSNHGSATYTYLSGTSMASPHVAGLAGLIKSALPSISRSELQDVIINTTDNIDGINSSYVGLLGSGRINAHNAISEVLVAQIDADNNLGESPFEVNFSGSAFWNVDTWTWSFGDGDSATGQNVVHTYLNPGAYDVSLEAIGPERSNTTILSGYIVAYADTIEFSSIQGDGTESLEIDVLLTNYAPTEQLTIPVEYSGDLNIALDSVSVVGTRGEAFEFAFVVHSEPDFQLFTVKMIADNGGGSEPLPPGSGSILKLYFRYLETPTGAGVNVVDTTRYSSYLFQAETSLGEYIPVILPGEINMLIGLIGDADLSGSIDISDAVYLIAFIFAGGPTPPLYNGDADCSGGLDISDAVYLIAFIFNGGPPPCGE